MEPEKTKQIIEKLEKLAPGQSLVYKLSPTFGGHTCILGVNDKKGKREYALRWGKSEELAQRTEPFIRSDKAKKLAGWLGDRAPEWIGERSAQTQEKAA